MNNKDCGPVEFWVTLGALWVAVIVQYALWPVYAPIDYAIGRVRERRQ